ncbi:MAG: PfkB family carbohydrate kinase [Candidatus Omnitrophica bacterium]|nr:PfkB family carbohydrate kinase [Candidatus Omnitrophota bacterium]MDD5513015.1 PfkB family carbohydrate kinase [Candidatus Omnitrophota bacterium]
MSILVLGTVALDTVKTPCGTRSRILGGSAVHFSMSARLFTTVNLVAIVGKDFPQKHIDFLRQKGLILSSLIRSPGKTFQWSGEYAGDLNSALTLSTELGVLLAFRPSVSHAQRRIKNIFLANIDPDLQKHLLGHMHSPQLVALDSMNYWINNKRASLLSLLKKVNIFVANDQEARQLSGETNLVRAAKSLLRFGPQMVLVKKGEHGVLFCGDEFICSLPGYPVEKVVDPTGAGDTFAGGFMGHLARTGKINSSVLKKALAYGTVAASYNIEGFGLKRTALFTRRDLERRLAEFRKSVVF